MNTKEMRGLSQAELRTELDKLMRQGFNLRIMKGSMQTVKPHLFKEARRSIARIKTIMAEKQEEGK